MILICHVVYCSILIARYSSQGPHRPGKVLKFDIGPWKLLEFEKRVFVLELSWVLVKYFWKYELVLEKYEIQRVLLDLWDAQTTMWKSPKTEWKSLDTRQRARCDSIQFNSCGSPGFYHWNRNQRKRMCLFCFIYFHFNVSGWKKCIFRVVFIEDWEEIGTWKIKKSPGILFSHFCMNSVFQQTTNKLAKLPSMQWVILWLLTMYQRVSKSYIFCPKSLLLFLASSALLHFHLQGYRLTFFRQEEAGCLKHCFPITM